jgi:hypothetical protein
MSYAPFQLLIFLVIISLSVGYFKSPQLALSTNFSGGDNPYGKPLEEWAKEYWQWLATLPQDVSVDPKTNLAECIVGSDRQGMMIFLRNVYDFVYSTKCDISSKSPILVPLLIGECDPVAPGAKSSKIEDLRACARDADETMVSWEVKLDNRVLFKKAGTDEVNAQWINQILVRNSSLFNITFPENNQFEADPGTYPAVVDGYYLILDPLLPGEHTLAYKYTHKQEIPGADLSYVNGEATYFLNVN